MILVLGTLLYADIFETKNRIGLSVSPGVLCDGHQGTYACNYTLPNTVCINIKAYLAGPNASGIYDANRKYLLGQPQTITCSYKNPQEPDCFGTAFDLDTTCIPTW